MKKLALLIVGILFFQLSYSQENYLKGHIITSNGDNISGFVDYRNWDSNPNSVNFKSSLDNKIKEYTPSDLLQFGVADEIYITAIVDMEISAKKTNYLNDKPKLKLETDTVFLQTIIKGEKSLYFYKDRSGFENFYIHNNDAYQLLIYKKYLKKVDKKDVIISNNKYIGQLTIYLNDCPTISSKISTTKYNIYSLKRLFEAYYNECTETTVSFQKETGEDLIEWGILGGISHTTIEFTGSHFVHLDGIDFPSSTNISAGAYLELIFRRNFNRWSINTELIYTSFSTHGSYQDHFKDITTELAFSYAKLNLMARYKYPIGKTHIYANIGISNGLIISETNSKHIESSFNAVIIEEEAIKETRDLEFGFLFGVGVKWKRFSLETRYEKGNGMSPYIDLASRTKRYYVLLGFRF